MMTARLWIQIECFVHTVKGQGRRVGEGRLPAEVCFNFKKGIKGGTKLNW